MKKSGLLLLIFILTSNAVAVDWKQESDIETTKSNGSAFKSTDDGLSDVEKTLAKQWMLEESDWVKYKEIMEGPRGVWSPGLDPITALGVTETDPKMRARYADIWMKIESKRTELELAFEVERMKASHRVHGDTPRIDNSAMVQQWREEQARIKTKVLLFVDTTCREACLPMFKTLWESIGNNTQLDVIFNEGATSEAIAQWANHMDISPSLVKSKKVTLNFDYGSSDQYDVDLNALPQIRVKDLDSGQISESKF